MVAETSSSASTSDFATICVPQNVNRERRIVLRCLLRRARQHYCKRLSRPSERTAAEAVTWYLRADLTPGHRFSMEVTSSSSSAVHFSTTTAFRALRTDWAVCQRHENHRRARRGLAAARWAWGAFPHSPTVRCLAHLYLCA